MPTNNSINSQDPIQVSKGGTGQSTLTTANGILAAGSSPTSAIQNIGTGSAGQVLTSNGTSLPSFQTAQSGAMVLLHTITFNNTASSYDITPYLSSTYKTYKFIATEVQNIGLGSGANLSIRVSTNGGTSFITSGYTSGLMNFLFSGVPSGPFTTTDRIIFCWLDVANTFYTSLDGLLTGYLSSTGVQFTATQGRTGTEYYFTNSIYPSATVNGLQLVNSGGQNFTAGKVSIYGIVQ